MDTGAASYLRFLNGDDEGIVEIIRDYKDGLILFLIRYTKNIHIAEELAEDTFFRLVTKKPNFTARYSFKTWLYTIGRNTAVNYLKRSGKLSVLPTHGAESMVSDEESLEQSYIREEQKILLYRALSKIKSDYSRVLYLKYFEDMSSEQIAAVMKKSRRQIENLVYHAKRSLRAELEKEGFHYEGL